LSPLILPVKFSEEAKKEILSLLATAQIPSDHYLRIGTEGGGCAGVRFVIGFDEMKKNDRLDTSGEFAILFAQKDFMHLLGKRIDFLENGTERGFVFSDDQDAG
jgi:iron-sulfur cluster assembly protein